MSDIKVTITGTQGSGKSMLAYLISNLLREYGIEATVDGSDFPPGDYPAVAILFREKRPNIEIVTEQI